MKGHTEYRDILEMFKREEETYRTVGVGPEEVSGMVQCVHACVCVCQ